jgi:hypothetical protein
VTAGGGCSDCKTGTGSLGLACGVGECCTGGFSSTTCAAGSACASSDAFVLLLRWTGAAFGSLGSAGFRGFRVFFSTDSGALGSFAFGLGPGFLRGCPEAVRPRGAGDPVAGVVVLVPTPTPPAAVRMVDVGVPCSGECGGELRLPGEDASSTSIAQNTDTKDLERVHYSIC